MKATPEGPSAGGCRNGNSPHEVFFREIPNVLGPTPNPSTVLSVFFCVDHPYFQEPLGHMCSPTPMHYCTSQPHPYALLHKPAPPLCTIAQANPTPMHYCTSQPHHYALLHKPAPPLCTIAQASPTPICTIAQASPHYCTSQPHPYALLQAS